MDVSIEALIISLSNLYFLIALQMRESIAVFSGSFIIFCSLGSQMSVLVFGVGKVGQAARRIIENLRTFVLTSFQQLQNKKRETDGVTSCTL